jgi:flagellar biosynthesis/type III secretory pathway protein FliH
VSNRIKKEREGGKEGRKEGRKKGRKEGGKEGRKEGGREGRKEGKLPMFPSLQLALCGGLYETSISIKYPEI